MPSGSGSADHNIPHEGCAYVPALVVFTHCDHRKMYYGYLLLVPAHHVAQAGLFDAIGREGVITHNLPLVGDSDTNPENIGGVVA